MVQATVEGLGAVVFTARAVVGGVADPNTARLIIVSGNRQVGMPGKELPKPLVVRLADQFGKPLVGELVTAAIIDGDGVLLGASPESASVGVSQTQEIDADSPVTVPTDEQGEAAFELQLGDSGESVTVRVTAASLPPSAGGGFLTVIGLKSPQGIAVEATNSLVVVDNDLRAVVRVDPGERSAAIVGEYQPRPSARPLSSL